VGDSQIDVTFNPYTFQEGCADESFTYTGLLDTDMPLPYFITLTGRTFSIYTTDDNDVGTYTVKVKATFPDSNFDDSLRF